jgi:nicotinamidase-related amidase
MTTALLVIDVQQILCSGDYPAFGIERVIDRINAVSRKARAAGVLVVVVQHETVGGGGMDYGTDGWKLAPELDTHTSDVLLRKAASDAFHGTELQAVLQARRIARLVICGLQSDFCVDSTTRRALALGYPVTLVSDGHSTLDNGVLTAAQISAHHNQTLAHLDSYGPRVTTVLAEDVRFET